MQLFSIANDVKLCIHIYKYTTGSQNTSTLKKSHSRLCFFASPLPTFTLNAHLDTYSWDIEGSRFPGTLVYKRSKRAYGNTEEIEGEQTPVDKWRCQAANYNEDGVFHKKEPKGRKEGRVGRKRTREGNG